MGQGNRARGQVRRAVPEQHLPASQRSPPSAGSGRGAEAEEGDGE